VPVLEIQSKWRDDRRGVVPDIRIMLLHQNTNKTDQKVQIYHGRGTVERSTVSKAELRSSKMTATIWPWSMAQTMSLCTTRMANSVK